MRVVPVAGGGDVAPLACRLQRGGLLRFVWAAPLVMLAYANALTYSRGGLLGLLGGLGLLFYFRFGLTKALIVGVVIIPTFLLLMPDRDKDIDLRGGTGHQRIL